MFKEKAATRAEPVRRAPIQARFEKLDSLLVEKGFNRIPYGEMVSPNAPSVLVRHGEVIYNRGIGADGRPNGKSNYYVFVKMERELLEVMFCDPSHGFDAAKLTPKQIRRHYSTTGRFEGFEEEVVQDVMRCSANKATHVFFGYLHGHWGTINGESMLRLNIDDGMSSDFVIIRNMMLYNYDFDASGFHNHWLAEHHRYLAELEATVGIVKVPSLELTFPYKNGAKNGPHLNIYIANAGAAESYASGILSKRSGEYAPFAPNVPPDEILQIHRKMAKEGELAVGMAHFFANHKLPGIGAGNRVAMGDWDYDGAMDFIENDVHGVEAFNIETPVKQLARIVRPQDREAFRKLADSQGFSKGTLSPNVLNLAIAANAARLGKWGYVGHDTHLFFEPRYDRFRWIVNRLGRATNAFDLLGMPHQPEKRKPTAAEFVGVMLSADANNRIHPFIPYEIGALGFADLVKNRNTDGWWDGIKERLYDAYNYGGRIPTLVKDWWHSAWAIYR